MGKGVMGMTKQLSMLSDATRVTKILPRTKISLRASGLLEDARYDAACALALNLAKETDEDWDDRAARKDNIRDLVNVLDKLQLFPPKAAAQVKSSPTDALLDLLA
jgi:hypothetical protein